MRKHILYLASGSSRRFGENKLLYPKNGKPLFLWGLEMLMDLVKDRRECTLTVISRYETIRETAKALGLSAVDSPESEKGVSYTIKAGLQALGELDPGDFLLFVVADQPNLKRSSVEHLLAQAREETEGACLGWGDRPGNPTLFSAKLLPELLALEGDMGGRAVLSRHGCTLVQADSLEELEDIDTKLDMEKAIC